LGFNPVHPGWLVKPPYLTRPFLSYAMVNMKGNLTDKAETTLINLANQNALASIESGNWENDVVKQAELVALQALTMIGDRMEDINPNHWTRTATEAFGIAQTLKGKPSRMSATLGVTVDGKDLGREELVKLVSSASSKEITDQPGEPEYMTKMSGVKTGHNAPTVIQSSEDDIEIIDVQAVTEPDARD